MVEKIDDDERTNAVGLFNTARSYWRSAEYLNAAKLRVTHPHAPITFLFCHAIELYLKAYLRGTGSNLADLKKLSHRIVHLAKAATERGLELRPEVSEVLSHVDDADVAIEARYIVTGFAQRLPNEALGDAAGRLDDTICTALAAAGHPVRHERFDARQPAQKSELTADTTRVLVYLFGTDEYDDRAVGAISRNLQMQKAMVKYHLDELDRAKLAACGSWYDGDAYWGITPAGRSYVVQHGLLEDE
jgi:hypothetical protein